jgi:transposase
MAQNFLSCDREQVMLLPACVSDWLPDGHLARFVIDVVDALDLSEIVGAYRADGSGAAAHDPAMMVALVFYNNAVGVRSSRQIERRCVEDVPCRVLAANRVPDHVTIARFRRRHAVALAGLFDQVLELCARSGLVQAATIAIDATKLRANAGLGATRSYQRIAEELLADAERVDSEEDEQFGDRRGDELPAELADRQTRKARLVEAKRQMDLEREAEQAAYEQKLTARVDYQKRTGRGMPGRKPQPPEQHSDRWRRSETRNVTDPDSRVVSHRGQLIQGYNAQVAVCENRVIVAADVTSSPNDSGQLEPVSRQALDALGRLGVDGQTSTVLADGGYWNAAMIAQLKDRGVEVLSPPDGPKTTGADPSRKPRQGPQAEQIAAMLATDKGKARYRRRAAIVEPVFAEIKHTLQITQFLRRGLDAVREEFSLIATTHNLRRLYFAAASTA